MRPIYLYEKGYFKINNPDIEKNLRESKKNNWKEAYLDDRFQFFWDGFFQLWDGSLVDTKGEKRRNESDEHRTRRNQVIRELPDLLRKECYAQNYSLPDWVSEKEMQEILVNYLYIKNYIRNRTNHAGGNEEENGRGSKAQEKLFKNYRYPVVDTVGGMPHISAELVSDGLRRGIVLIKSIQIKKAKMKRKNSVIIVRL